ncbi:MAG: hypothetical protein KGI50_04220 [Patescibacteria group bacterium]|nr:hypothetical protein [Patescibacteria group bacterium]
MRQFLLFVFAVLFAAIPVSYAASSHFLTWKTNTYVPQEFWGKPLPIKGSAVTLSVQSLDPQESFSNIPITWYVDNIIIAQGNGLSTTPYTVTEGPGLYVIKAFLRLPDGTPETLTAPLKVVAPFVSLVEQHAATVNHQISTANTELRFHAIPLFYNTSSLLGLAFTWGVGDVTSEDQNPQNPDYASITFPEGASSGSRGTVTVSVTNIAHPDEHASQYTTVITPQ